jgi:phage gpG-like protein
MDRKIILPQIRSVGVVKDFIERDVPRIVKTEALNAIQETFTNQGFTDKTLKKWPERKAPKRNGKAITGKTLEKWEAKNRGRAILVGHAADTKGGHMKDGFTGEATPEKVTIHNDKIYWEVHNDGLQAGRPPGFTMPERRMIGESETTENKIMDKIERVLHGRLNTV